MEFERNLQTSLHRQTIDLRGSEAALLDCSQRRRIEQRVSRLYDLGFARLPLLVDQHRVALREGAAFDVLAREPDREAFTQQRADRQALGHRPMDAGAFVRALEYASGTEALVLGKPARGFFEAAAASMGCALADVAMVGDDAEADVAGALAAGAGLGVLVRTGKYRDGDERRFRPGPSAVAADLAAAVEWLLQQR